MNNGKKHQKKLMIFTQNLVESVNEAFRDIAELDVNICLIVMPKKSKLTYMSTNIDPKILTTTLNDILEAVEHKHVSESNMSNDSVH